MKIEKRDYTKKELSMLCNPGMDYYNAYQKFYRDVTRCTQLMQELRQRGYNPKKHYLHYWQVRLILKYVYPEMEQ
ncbi:MAG: DUF4248 domain-containing protein [Bacteroidaceae bacterium]|nr:DUF4248 domain-containing protein [Bacteroidaceae bacterium]